MSSRALACWRQSAPMPSNALQRAEKWKSCAGHAQYYGNIILNQAAYGIYSANALHWLNWLEREFDNIRATLSWCVDTPEGVELGAGLAWSLDWFWYRRGYLSEGRLWTKQVLASPVSGGYF